MKAHFIPSLKLSSGQNNSEIKKLFIKSETGMGEVDMQHFIWPETNKETFILGSFGSECLSLHGLEVLPEDVGLKNFIYSLDMKIISIPWCYNTKTKLSIIGTIGINVRLNWVTGRPDN